MVFSALSEPLTFLLVSVALCDFIGLLSAFLHENFAFALELNMSDAVQAKELIFLTWANSVSLSFLDCILAKLLIVTLNNLSCPLCGLLSRAWPVVDVDGVFVFRVSGGKASLALQVLNFLSVELNWLRHIIFVVFSENEILSWLD